MELSKFRDVRENALLGFISFSMYYLSVIYLHTYILLYSHTHILIHSYTHTHVFGNILTLPFTHTYIHTAILKTHCRNKMKTVHAMAGFRNFLAYHIKCAKSFFHERMRLKVKSLLLVLNRAARKAAKKKEKKTISGRTFKRH